MEKTNAVAEGTMGKACGECAENGGFEEKEHSSDSSKEVTAC